MDSSGFRPVEDLSLMTTMRCNSRCRMCDIWKTNYDRADMSRDIVGKLRNSDVLKKSRMLMGKNFDVTFTGGEPFIREDFPEFFSWVEDSLGGSSYTISTNGMMTERVLGFLEENCGKRITLHFSVDGGKETHDKQRGISGAYSRTMKTAKMVRERFPGVRTKFKFTITPELSLIHI